MHKIGVKKVIINALTYIFDNCTWTDPRRTLEMVSANIFVLNSLKYANLHCYTSQQNLQCFSQQRERGSKCDTLKQFWLG